MLNQSDYLGVDAVTLSASIRAGDFTVSELTECAINRAEAVEPVINSIVTRNFNAAMDVTQGQSYAADLGLGAIQFLQGDFKHASKCYSKILSNYNYFLWLIDFFIQFFLF